MKVKRKQRRLSDGLRFVIERLSFLFIFIVLIIIAVYYARGYRFNFVERSITPTGILAVSSNQRASKVLVNGVLKGVTDINITLPPGEYSVTISKEGYTSWNSYIKLKGEIVTSINGFLFPSNPSLSPLTNLGVKQAIRVDQTDKILLIADNDNPDKDGIYMFDTSSSPLSLFPPLQPIILKKNVNNYITSLEDVKVVFAPNYTQGIFEFKTATETLFFLLSLDRDNTDLTSLTSESKDSLISAWDEERVQEVTKIVEAFPKDIQKIASESFHIISFSPDQTKILYTANNSFVLPPIIHPPLIGTNQTKESRDIQKSHLYVYDRKEDKNFLMSPELLNQPTSKVFDQPLLLWHPNSRHLFSIKNNTIEVVDYDNTNKRTVYSGPFEKNFYSITSSGRLLVLSNLNPQNNKFPDVYEIGIR
ncbi:MAG: PEGA domain-containing protein [Candidatus Roizmanbacteria bacterium]